MSTDNFIDLSLNVIPRNKNPSKKILQESNNISSSSKSININLDDNKSINKSNNKSTPSKLKFINKIPVKVSVSKLTTNTVINNDIDINNISNQNIYDNINDVDIHKDVSDLDIHKDVSDLDIHKDVSDLDIHDNINDSNNNLDKTAKNFINNINLNPSESLLLEESYNNISTLNKRDINIGINTYHHFDKNDIKFIYKYLLKNKKKIKKKLLKYNIINDNICYSDKLLFCLFLNFIFNDIKII